MHTVLTVSSGLILAACIWAAVVVQRIVDQCHQHALKAESAALKLRDERARVTVLERDVEALRRELRKLSGKFYATLREAEAVAESREDSGEQLATVHAEVPRAPFCPNYGQAQIEGPQSPAAACECGYCVEMRARREQFRSLAVPRTVRGQAELAKLNAGKP